MSAERSALRSNHETWSLAGMRVLITGVCGLVGRELAAQLAERGAIVHGVDLRQWTGAPLGGSFTRGDLADEEVCRRACDGVDAIVHNAARQYGPETPRFAREAYFAPNVAMTRRLIDAARARRITRLVYVSSDMVYGMPPGRALRETDRPTPLGPYGRSKLAGEEIARGARTGGMNATILRPRLIVGRGRLGVLQKLFDRVYAHQAIPLIGDGRNRYQMVAVADVASACVLALEHGYDDVFNLGSADPPPVRDLLMSLIERAGSKSRLIATPAGLACAGLRLLDRLGLSPLTREQFAIAPVDYVLDCSKAATRLNWRPRFADADMLWQAYEVYIRSKSEIARRTAPAAATQRQVRENVKPAPTAVSSKPRPTAPPKSPTPKTPT